MDTQSLNNVEVRAREEKDSRRVKAWAKRAGYNCNGKLVVECVDGSHKAAVFMDMNKKLLQVVTKSSVRSQELGSEALNMALQMRLMDTPPTTEIAACHNSDLKFVNDKILSYAKLSEKTKNTTSLVRIPPEYVEPPPANETCVGL